MSKHELSELKDEGVRALDRLAQALLLRVEAKLELIDEEAEFVERKAIIEKEWLDSEGGWKTLKITNEDDRNRALAVLCSGNADLVNAAETLREAREKEMLASRDLEVARERLKLICATLRAFGGSYD